MNLNERALTQDSNEAVYAVLKHHCGYKPDPSRLEPAMFNIIQYLDILAVSEAVRGFSIHKKPDTVYMCHGQKGKMWGPMCEAIDVLDQEAGLGGSKGVNDAVESTLESMKGNVVGYVGGVRKKAHRVCQDQDPPIRTIHKHGRGRTAGKAAMDSRVLMHAYVHQTGNVDDIMGVAGTPESMAHQLHRM
jgi:hypothetical protein